MDNKYLKIVGDYDAHCLHVIKSTVVDTTETFDERIKRVKRLEKDYITWFEYYFAHYAKVKSGWFHKKLANYVINNKKVRLLAEIFRSGGKSVHIDMGIPLYLYLVKKELGFLLLIGETEKKAQKLISGVQAELSNNQKIKNDYGNKTVKGDWAEGDFYTNDGVRFMALGFGQSPRGLREGATRPDYIVIDDVDTKRHLNNNTIMQESVDYITEEVEGCFDSDSDANARERMVYANNNFHKNSITNRLKKFFNHNIGIDEEEGVKSDYVVFTVTAAKDIINFEPNWKEKTTAEYLRRKYTRNKRGFLREQMHVHVSEGKIFKPEYIHYKDMLQLDKYEALIFIGDLSYKDKGDFKAMFLVGKIKKEYHIIHSLTRQTSRKNVARWMYDLYELRLLTKYNIRYLIDGLFAQDEFISDFDREGEERGYYIPVIANKKNYGNKFDHIESVEGFFERGWVFWNNEERNTIDQVEAIDQFMSFEKGSQAHDDAPDAIAVGIKELEQITFQEKFEPVFVKRETKNKRF